MERPSMREETGERRDGGGTDERTDRDGFQRRGRTDRRDRVKGRNRTGERKG